MSTLWRHSKSSRYVYLYTIPGYPPVLVYCAYGVAVGLDAAWGLVAARGHVLPSFFLALFISVCLTVCLALSAWVLKRHAVTLLAAGYSREIFLTRLLIHNGLAMYAVWSLLGAIQTLARFLTYRVNMEPQDASSVSLGAVALVLAIYFILEVAFLDPFTRYVMTPYLGSLIWEGAVLHECWALFKRNFIFTAILTTLTVVMLIGKVAVISYRSRHQAEPLAAPAPTVISDKPNNETAEVHELSKKCNNGETV